MKDISEFNIWEGVYPDYMSAANDAVGPGFAGERYRSRSLLAARECLDALSTGSAIPTFHKQRSVMLPPVVAARRRTLPWRVLDFGGGLGIGYMTLREAMPEARDQVDYSIVEVAEVCAAGRELHGDSITYLDAMPAGDKFNLVHAASALQYVQDWQAIIEKFISYHPDSILLSDVFAGDIESYGTLQNYYESRIAHWMLNLDRLLSVFTHSGYRLAMKMPVSARRVEADDILPMENLPEERRLKHTLHLLFNKI